MQWKKSQLIYLKGHWVTSRWKPEGPVGGTTYNRYVTKKIKIGISNSFYAESLQIDVQRRNNDDWGAYPTPNSHQKAFSGSFLGCFWAKVRVSNVPILVNKEQNGGSELRMRENEAKYMF